MIAVLDLAQRGERERGDGPVQPVRHRERVARALEKQHRRIDAPEMRVADALRLAGWVKGVAEKGESGGGRTVGHDMRGDAAAHRFAAEEWLRELCRYRLGYGAVTGLEPRLRVG